MFINHYLQFILDYFSTIKLYINDIKNKHFHIAVINSTVSISRSYMDNYTMAVMISMSTMAYAAILFTMYFIRKERSLILFTLAFVFATISGLSLSLQNLQNEFFGIIVFNVSFYLFSFISLLVIPSSLKTEISLNEYGCSFLSHPSQCLYSPMFFRFIG